VGVSARARVRACAVHSHHGLPPRHTHRHTSIARTCTRSPARVTDSLHQSALGAAHSRGVFPGLPPASACTLEASVSISAAAHGHNQRTRPQTRPAARDVFHAASWRWPQMCIRVYMSTTAAAARHACRSGNNTGKAAKCMLFFATPCFGAGRWMQGQSPTPATAARRPNTRQEERPPFLPWGKKRNLAGVLT